MKSLLLILLTISVTSIFTFSKDDPMFDKYFKDQTMRIDYYHIGDAKTEIITIDKVYKYGIWAGSKTNLIDKFNNGKFYYKIYDLKSGDLIYSKGFDSYFGEYVTSQEALDGIKRTLSGICNHSLSKSKN